MAKYRFLVCDLVTDTLREEMPFENVSYGDVLNAPGSFSGELPLSLKRTLTAVKSYSSTIRADGPVGYWRLGEATGTTANDSAGTQNGTYSGGFTLAQTGLVPNDADRAVKLNGSTGFVSIPDNNAWSPATTGALTVCAIFTPTALPAGAAFANIVAKRAASNFEWSIRLNSSGTVQLILWNASGTGLLTLSSLAPVTLGQTYVVHATIDNTPGVCTLTLNGVQQANGTPSGSTVNGTAAVNIGATGGGGIDFFTGTVDEVAIFPTILSATRIAAHQAAALGTPETTTVSYDVVTRANLDPGRTAIYVERDNSLVWGGVLWTARASEDAFKVTFGAEGFWSYFRRRLLRATKVYAAQDPLFIARDLINYAQAVNGGNIGVVVGSETSGASLSRTYKSYERVNIGQAVEDLASTDGGFDFAIDVAYDASGNRTKNLHLSYPRRGSLWPFTLDLAANLEAFSWDIDATKQANLIDGLGAGEGDSMVITTAADTSQIGTFPLLEDTVSYKDAQTSAILTALTKSALTASKNPIETLSDVALHPSILLQIGQFRSGDTVDVRTTNAGGFFAIASTYRALTWTVEVDDNGKEVIKLDLVPLEAFS